MANSIEERFSAGAQFEITRGAARAVISEIGAGLRAFEIAGVPYVEPVAEGAKPPKAVGEVLLPWPNRTRAARWEYQGQPQELEVTEPARGNAIHGLVRFREWTLVEHAESAVTLEIGIDGEPGWPVPLHARISYQVHPRGLTVEYELRNEGESAIGVGVGSHPYFRIGDVPTGELELTLAATRVRPFLDGEQLPYAPEQDVEGTEYDLRAGRPLAEVDLDTAFGGLIPGQDGLHHHLLRHGETTLDVWAGPDFRWAQVFTPADLETPDGGTRAAVAIEPMTCPADALNSGTDLIELAAGASWTGSWGISLG